MNQPSFRSIAEALLRHRRATTSSDREIELVVDALRLVWNARGAADVAKLETTIPEVRTVAEPAGAPTRASPQ